LRLKITAKRLGKPIPKHGVAGALAGRSLRVAYGAALNAALRAYHRSLYMEAGRFGGRVAPRASTVSHLPDVIIAFVVAVAAIWLPGAAVIKTSGLLRRSPGAPKPPHPIDSAGPTRDL
jgi:hypothetical protein